MICCVIIILVVRDRADWVSQNYKNYAHQIEILAAWSKKLRFSRMALADEVTAMEEESWLYHYSKAEECYRAR